jgi:predicted nucleotidyltransferase
MNQLVADKLFELKKICEKNSVSELFLFGSALSQDNFDENSDIDFAVIFNAGITPLELGSSFLNLLSELENLFNRKIDLISYRVVKNPVFKKELDKTKKILYAAA